MKNIRYFTFLFLLIFILNTVMVSFSYAVEDEVDNEIINEQKENEELVEEQKLNQETELNQNQNIEDNIDEDINQENNNQKKSSDSNLETTKKQEVLKQNEPTKSDEPEEKEIIGVEYYSHVQDKGWEQEYKFSNGEISGTTGRNLKIEAMKIRLTNAPEGSSIRYKPYLQGKGWQNITKDGELAGTTGQNRKMEAIQIDLVGLDDYSVKYRVHVQDKGWQDWCYDGDIAGTVEERLKIEAIQIEIVEKEIRIPSVGYRSHIQDRGWERTYVFDGKQSGTTGRNLKVEAMQIQLKNGGSIDSHIKYISYVQGIGWQNWKNDLEITGTTGQNKKLFALRIRLEGVEGYSVKYRAHIQDIGWTEWKSDGTTVGATTSSKKIEAIQIMIDKTENVTKNMHLEYSSKIQGSGWEQEFFHQDSDISGITGKNKKIEAMKIRLVNAPIGASIKYRAYVEGIGWQDWCNEAEIAGNEKEEKRIYGIRIISEGLENYSVQYRAHIQDIGWQAWKTDGLTAGAIGKSKKIEAFQIRIVPKVKVSSPYLEFYSYIHNIGWEEEYNNQSGEITGLPGQSRIMESIKIRLKNAPENAHVKYKLHISDIGWTDWYGDGEEAGTPQSGKKIEAIQIKLENMNKYTVEYKTYIQGMGWQGLRQDGKSAGTTGKNLRVEGIIIDLVGKYKSEFRGIDVSKHNGTIDFGSLITNNNLDFMIIRVGYGRHDYQKDEQFERNYELAKAYGIPIGAYLYSYATDVDGAEKEAYNMLNWIRGKKFELPVFYDIEDPTQYGDEQRATNTNMCNRFCSIISSAGYQAGIYSGKFFANNYINLNSISSKYALWIAAYGNKTDGTVPADIYKFKEYHDIWQYSSTGHMNGINGNVDMNICYNTTYFGRN